MAVSTAWQQVAQQLALDRTLAEVAHLLAQRGVRPVLLKGPVIARWLYDDPTERPYGDIDLLVAPDHFETAQNGLAELGFELQPAAGQGRGGAQLGADGRPEEFGFHTVWVRRGTLDGVVELHRTLALLSASPSLVWQRLSAGTSLMEVARARVDVPSPAASALIIGLHAAQHGPAFSKPLHDLARALERIDITIWRAAAALARELGGGAAFAVGLRLDPAGRELADQLGLPAGTRFIERGRGRQAGDLVPRLRATAVEVEAALGELASGPAAGYVDVPYMRDVWRMIQREDTPEAFSKAITVLTRGIMAGLFVNSVENGTIEPGTTVPHHR